MTIVVQAFVDHEIQQNITKSFENLPPGVNITIPEVKGSGDLMTVVGRFGWGMAILAAIIWGLSWVFVSCLNYAAARQVGLYIIYLKLNDKVILLGFQYSLSISPSSSETRYWMV